MSNYQQISAKNPAVIAKAGLWYTICEFLFKGMVFITTPIFARLLSKEELGSFANFSSWILILTVVTSFDFSQSVIRSKVDHEKDIDTYIWSILALSSLWTLIIYGVFLLFPSTISNLLSIEKKYINIMFFYLLFSPAYNMLITKHRAFYRYKSFILLTGIMTLSGTFISLALTCLMQDKLAGRIYGYYLPFIIVSIGIYVLLALRGRKVKIDYWKYACAICLPLVPHVLSMYLLGSSDTLIITKLCGAQYTAAYSIAYSAYHITTLLFNSMNRAWAPWLLDSLHAERYSEIRKISKIYISIFEVLIVGVLLLVPEIIILLGGQQYIGAVYCLPPLITACSFLFVYTMYVNIEFYEKKTIGVTFATTIATALNIILNLTFIPMNPEYSYVIAAYTTLVSFIVLFGLHYYMVRRMKMDHVYDTDFILFILTVTFVISSLMNFLYTKTLVRYALTAIYCFMLLISAYRYKNKIIGIFKSKS